MSNVVDDMLSSQSEDSPLFISMQDPPPPPPYINDDIIDLGNEQEDEDEGSNPVRKKRKLMSMVWDHFVVIERPNGIKIAKCKHCKKELLKKGSTTTQFKRHLNNCTMRKDIPQSQQVLAFGYGSESGKISNFKYDQDKVRESIAHFILMHEHPFSIVEQEGFIYMMKTTNCLFQKISRGTIKNDCMAVYESEKKKLKSLLTKINKISLTTDCWKSNSQQIEYMVVTGHFIDSDWLLQKRVLSFVHVPPPRGGVELADALFKCIHEWGIESKVFSLSVDNATYNDVVIRIMKSTFLSSGKLLLGGKLFHIRCCAHILNILVQDGLKEIKDITHNIRESVKFLKYSEARMQKFCEVVQQLKLHGRKLVLDTPTRWNSTFEMLSIALKFKKVFPIFKDREPTYKNLPSMEDWIKIEHICEVLEVFEAATKIISGRAYPTSNLFLTELYAIKELLDEKAKDSHDFIRNMVEQMKIKFDKYWGNCNLLIAIASFLDPRCKMMMIDFCFPLIYSQDEASKNIEIVRNAINDLYAEYASLCSTNEGEVSVEGNENGVSLSQIDSFSESTVSRKTPGWVKFDKFVKANGKVQPSKSDLDKYLDEGVHKYDESEQFLFDVVKWWSDNMMKFPILSKMACDILAIPISTVASEATFSAGDRVIDTYRASLSIDTVQALICGGDWVRNYHGVKNKSKVSVRFLVVP